MRRSRAGWTALLLAAALAFSGCGGAAASASANPCTPADDIVSYKPVDANKTVIRVGRYLVADTDTLEAELEQEFPAVDFVFTEPDAGDNDVAYMKLIAQHGALEDILLCSHALREKNDFLYDLSGEDFTGRYNLSSLDSMNVDGCLYQLPISNTVYGIAYNKTLFAAHGWSVPATLDDFYALCDTIAAAGIRPFVPCFKYYTVLESVGFGLSFDQVFASAENQVKYQAFCRKTGSCRGLLEPSFEAVRGLYEKGYVTADDFSSSATELRQDLYAGKVAMMPSNVSIASFVEQEKPAAEIGFIGFPTQTPGARWMQMVPGSMLSVSAASMQDADKKKILLDVLDYFSTAEGQDALFRCFSGVSSLIGYQQQVTDVSQEMQDCLDQGHVFFADYYASNSFVPTWQSYVTGELPLEDFLTASDASKAADYYAALDEPPIGRASADFTVLDTSLYNADVMRQDTGAEIALILNGYFYTGNLARIFAGDIVLPGRFVLKGVGAKNYLTTYAVTGANLKKLMEHPIINGAEVNAMYACSGLKMTYAPWADEDANVLSLTLADGTPIDDAKTYTVAAWAGSLDESCCASVVQEYPELGMNRDIMTAAIQAAGTIAPARDGRITLDWTVSAAGSTESTK